MTVVRRRLASAAVATALLGGVAAPAVMLAPVAAAHSVLVSVDPEDGARLENSPGQVVLTFNEEINPSFASVAVSSGDDRANLVTGQPSVDGGTVTAQLPDLGPGAYTVGYRVTSADGHVVSGSTVFTLVGATGSPTSAPGGAGSSTGAAPAVGTETAGPDAGARADDVESTGSGEASDEDSGLNPVIWVVGGLAVLLIGGAFVLLRRGN